MPLQIAVTLASLVTLFLAGGACNQMLGELHELDFTDVLIEFFFTACVATCAIFAMYAVWQ